MTNIAPSRLTVRDGFSRLLLCGVAGALVGAVVWFAWTAATPPGGDPAGLYLLLSPVVGAFFGLFGGGVLGWLWLVVAVGRESRDRATVPPDPPPEPARRAPPEHDS